jgi:starvation-inducible DNA-binding protein
MKMASKKRNEIAKIDIGITEGDRATIAKGLSRLLADSYTLYLMTHNFHWNVTGPIAFDVHGAIHGTVECSGSYR